MNGKTLNDYGSIQLTNTMSDLVEMFNNNTSNNKLVDTLLNYTVDTGVFRTGEEKVCGLSIGPEVNVQIPSNKLSEIDFTGFAFYFKSLHKLFVEVPHLNISTYSDSKLHLIYLKSDLTYAILEDKYVGDEDYLYIGRFVLTANGLNQFYVITRNAGTNPFDKRGVSYNVIKGLVPKVKSGLTLTCEDGVVKYSGININSEIDTDIFTKEFEDALVNTRYITNQNKVDWTVSATNGIITNKYLHNNAISNVPSGKFTCQKIFYDYNSGYFIVQYGQVIYDSMNEALAGVSNFNYAEPDVDGLYIPVAIIVVKSGATDLTDSGNCKIISITDNTSLSSTTAVDPTAQELANTALQTAQAAGSAASTADGKAVAAQNRADSAYALAQTADGKATTANDNLSSHLSDTNNPHNVTKAQIGLSNVDNTKDANKPLSTPQKQYVDGKVTDLTNQINTKASSATQTKNVVKSTQPTNADFGRAPISGDLWLIP